MQWLLPHHTAIVLKMHQEDYRQFMASYKLQSLHPRHYSWSIYLLIGIQKTCGNNILKPALLKSHWTNEADQGTAAIFLMLSVSWSSSIGFQEQIFKKSSLFFLFNSYSNRKSMNSHALDCSNLDSWSEMMFCFLYIWSKNHPQNKRCCWFKRRWTSTLLVLWWPKHPDLHLPLIF